MAVTTTQSISKLLPHLMSDYPTIQFVAHHECKWSPRLQTVYYDPLDPFVSERVLHEVAHSILGHREYQRGIDLLAIERDAWHYAKTKLGPKYTIPISDSLIQDDLDTYREWLHARSLCPGCSSTGIETAKQTYHCPVCSERWTANTAITRQLKRKKIK